MCRVPPFLFDLNFYFFRLDYDGFYTRYSMENASRNGSTFNSLVFGPGGLGGPIRPSLSMSSIATLDGTVVGSGPRRLVGRDRGPDGDEETIASHNLMKQPTSNSMLPPLAPNPTLSLSRDRRNLQGNSNGSSAH